MSRPLATLGIVSLVATSTACADPDAPPRERLRQPTGIAVSPDGSTLFVANGNLDFGVTAGTLQVLDLVAVHQVIAEPASTGQAGARCWVSDAEPPIECDASAFIDPAKTVILGSGLANIAIDRPGGADGPLRLLVAQRNPPAIVWLDAMPDGGGLRLDCGQTEKGSCSEAHFVTENPDNPNEDLPADPARVVVDDLGDRWAYVPHFGGKGELSLLTLDGRVGPELTSLLPEFYTPSPFDDLSLAGGFSVARRACDPALPIERSRDCTRPYLYTTQRYWPGLRTFTVAPGLELMLAGDTLDIAPLGSDTVESRPFMGDLAFENPSTGESLLVVQTTPSGLGRIDTSLDEHGNPKNELRAAVALCNNPNQLEVFRAPNEESLALVTCFGDGKLAVVALGSFTLLRTIQLGAGANELALDPLRRVVYVANVRDDSISVVGLDRTRPDFLTEIARLVSR